MWEQGEPSRDHEGPNDAFVTYSTVASGIRVLLVDHDKECLISTARMLELCSYRVTLVELASTALLMLSKGNQRFDLVMANVNSPDLHGFQLLDEAVNMELPMILMSNNEEVTLARNALERGAVLFLQKPITVEALMYLWQHVLREKKRTLREREIVERMSRDNRRSYRGRRSDEENGNENNAQQRKAYRISRYARGERETNEDGEFDPQNTRNKVRRKVCTEWTKELHAKFMDAVYQLGEGRCYPKEILELMNVPGLTRMQVASHLQKCRNDNWRPREERRSNAPNTPAPPSVGLSQSKSNSARRFGTMPLNAGEYQPPPPPMDNQVHFIVPEFYPSSVNSIFERGESSDQVNRPQLQLDPHYYNGNNQILGQLRPVATTPRGTILYIVNARDDAGNSRNVVVQNEMENGNGNLVPGSGTTFHQYLQIPGSDSHLSSPSMKQQTDEFFDLDMDYFVTDHFNDERPGPSNISQIPNHNGINLEQPFSGDHQNSMDSNMETKGKRN